MPDGDNKGAEGDAAAKAAADAAAKAAADKATADAAAAAAKAAEGDKGKGKETIATKGEGKADDKKDEKYELTLPKGAVVDKGTADGIAAFAKERGLSKEVAQALLDREDAQVRLRDNAVSDEFAKIQDSWRAATEKDPEIGGANLNRTAAQAHRALQKHDPKGELSALLNESRYGDHPAVLRFLSSVGAGMGDDRLVLSRRGAASGPKTLEERIYGAPKEKQE